MGGLKVWYQNNLIKFRLYCGSVIIVLSVNSQVLIYVKQVDLVTVLVLIKSFGKFRSGLILYVRGTRHKLAWKQKTCKSFHLHASFGCSIDIYTKEVPFLLWIWAPRSVAMLVGLLASNMFDTLATHAVLQMMNKNRLACNTFDTLATHTGLQMMSKNRLACNTLDTLATHAALQMMSKNRVACNTLDTLATHAALQMMSKNRVACNTLDTLATHAALQMMSKNRVACNTLDTLATHAGIVCYVTDTDFGAQYGSIHGHVYTTFKHQFPTNRIRNWAKHCCMCICYFHSCGQDPSRLFGLVPLFQRPPWICIIIPFPFLHWQEAESKRDFTRAFLNEITKEAVFSDRKRVELVRIWPAMFYSLVQSAVTQLMDNDSYGKNALDALHRS